MLATGQLIVQISVPANIFAVPRNVIENVRSLEQFLELGETLLPDQWLNPCPANLITGVEGV